MGVRGAQDKRLRQIIESKVIDIPALAGQKSDVFVTFGRFTNFYTSHAAHLKVPVFALVTGPTPSRNGSLTR
jgi:hypothetical protein